ncbi:MAG TPA: SAF domain-containing protein [Candidatus Limnocylindrales bacterium]|nr:SAF domain-containing protein [Candidatus Limnocylindrales bacterium]
MNTSLATRNPKAATQRTGDVAAGARTRRSPARLFGGAALALTGALVFAVVGLRVNPAVEVLTVARPVAAGAVMSDADLSTVRIVADPAMQVFTATQKAAVVGKTAAVPLVAGTLLTAGQLGKAIDPPVGQSVIAVGLKTGRAPADLSAGAQVLVVIVANNAAPGAESGASPPVQAQAVVRAVAPADNAGIVVVTVQLAAEAAVRIVSA